MNTIQSFADLAPLAPMLVVLGTAFLLLIAEVLAEGTERGWAASLSAVGLCVALVLAGTSIVHGSTHELFGSARHAAPLVIDPFAQLSCTVLLAAGLVATLISPAYLRHTGCASGEYYALMLMSLVGMMVMVMAADLFTLFLGIEVMSIAVYALTGIRSSDARSAEAALKYFLMGAFATGFLLFGIALIYGATGSVAFESLARAMPSAPADKIFGLGIVLVLSGLAFKVAAVPFHVWAPDVYEGAPTPVTGFMAVGVKAAAFIGLLRFVVVGMGGEAGAEGQLVVPLLTALAYLTIIVGNLLAVVQRNVKRMLAYSSISHAGYALIGVVAAALGERSAGPALLFYLTAYTFMTLGAFGVLAFLERKEGGHESERFGAFAGVGFRHPALGLAMVLFMIALAGMPLTGGFVGKLYLFSAALKAGQPGLVVVGVLGSLVSVYYYLRVIVAFYMRDIPDPGPLPDGRGGTQVSLGLSLAALGVLVLGLFPNVWIEVGKLALRSLAGS